VGKKEQTDEASAPPGTKCPNPPQPEPCTRFTLGDRELIDDACVWKGSMGDQGEEALVRRVLECSTRASDKRTSQGHVMMRWHVNELGKVTSFEITEDTYANDQIALCLSLSVRMTSFHDSAKPTCAFTQTLSLSTSGP
jgi:hypothetical protein